MNEAGNAADLAVLHRGWFGGQFISQEHELLRSDDVEIKRGKHQAGENRSNWFSNDATTLSVLFSGKFTLYCPNIEHSLSSEGDYVSRSPGTVHKWTAEADTPTLTVRWPLAKCEREHWF